MIARLFVAKAWRLQIASVNHLDLPFETYSHRFDSAHSLRLSRLIERARRLLASDPRDKIYGLLGLVSLQWIDNSPQRIRPTCNYSSTVHSCIREAVKVMIREDGNLLALVDNLYWPILGPNILDESWPSWTPRLDQNEVTPLTAASCAALDYWQNRADNRNYVDFRESTLADHPNVLFLGGFWADAVSSVCASFGDHRSQNFLTTVRSISRAFLHFMVRHFS